MDAKDLRTAPTLSERSNDGTKSAQGRGAIQCDKNKYQDIGSNSLSKVDAPPARPCAVIGPDRVIPPPTNDAYLKTRPLEPWPYQDNFYRHPPEYPHKIGHNQNPTRNISPRQTFQENMQRIMVPPTYSSLKTYDDNTYSQTPDKNITYTKNLKPSAETKYCDVPFNVSSMTNEPKKRSSEMCVPNVNPALVRTAPQGWPPGNVNLRPKTYGAPELYQYSEYPSCAGPRPAPMIRPHRTLQEDTGYAVPEGYYQDGNMRFKTHPAVKDRYPQARYEYIGNYPSPYHPAAPFPQHKYDLQKTIHPHPYPTYPPLKYVDNRLSDNMNEGYQRPPQSNYNIPFRNQIIHPTYGPMVGNCSQSKTHPYPSEGSIKAVASHKLPYDNNKMYLDYDYSRTKTYPSQDTFYVNEINRVNSLKNQVLMQNYPSVGVHPAPPHAYYRKDNLPTRSYDYIQHIRSLDPSMNTMNPMLRHPPQFSPNAIAISPTDSNTSNDTQTLSTSQEDCGYVSQSSTASVRSMESGNTRLPPEFYRRYDYRYGPLMRNTSLLPNANFNESKNKKQIDVRQFLQMWNEGDEENPENKTAKEIILQKGSNDDAKFSKHETICNQEQLYVLGLVNVPSEELSKYEHIQKVSKLPDNIKGYNSIELLNQFEEVIESSNINNYKSTPSAKKDFQIPPNSLPKQTASVLPRPLSPLDVEAKISQSVIHKEVGCNFEIKPCSPKMLNVEIATPVQNILNERVIEKVSNPLSTMIKSPLINKVEENINNFNMIKKSDHNENLKVPSCKMMNHQFSSNTIDIKTNYIQDLESNSGVGLASLPRLDNDIELNFPEVNQQFINANKVESSMMPTLHSKSKTMSKQDQISTPKDFYVNQQIESNFQLSSASDSEKESSKLSKYRKHKILEIQEQEKQKNSVRTDSVIIKNPENPKSHEDHYEPNNLNTFLNESPATQVNIITECNIQTNSGAIDNSKKTCTDFKQFENDVAIDFSLNRHTSDSENESSLNEYNENEETDVLRPGNVNTTVICKNLPELGDVDVFEFNSEDLCEHPSQGKKRVSVLEQLTEFETKIESKHETSILIKNDYILNEHGDCKNNIEALNVNTEKKLSVISENIMTHISYENKCEVPGITYDEKRLEKDEQDDTDSAVSLSLEQQKSDNINDKLNTQDHESNVKLKEYNDNDEKLSIKDDFFVEQTLKQIETNPDIDSTSEPLPLPKMEEDDVETKITKLFSFASNDLEASCTLNNTQIESRPKPKENVHEKYRDNEYLSGIDKNDNHKIRKYYSIKNNQYRGKELFSPIIQNLWLYNEGLCNNNTSNTNLEMVKNDNIKTNIIDASNANNKKYDYESVFNKHDDNINILINEEVSKISDIETKENHIGSNGHNEYDSVEKICSSNDHTVNEKDNPVNLELKGNDKKSTDDPSHLKNDKTYSDSTITDSESDSLIENFAPSTTVIKIETHSNNALNEQCFNNLSSFHDAKYTKELCESLLPFSDHLKSLADKTPIVVSCEKINAKKFDKTDEKNADKVEISKPKADVNENGKYSADSSVIDNKIIIDDSSNSNFCGVECDTVSESDTKVLNKIKDDYGDELNKDFLDLACKSNPDNITGAGNILTEPNDVNKTNEEISKTASGDTPNQDIISTSDVLDLNEDINVSKEALADFVHETKSYHIPKSKLKRSYSDSALNSLNEDQDTKQNVLLNWPSKRRKENMQREESNIIAQNICNIIQNNRRNSISSFYNEENVSFCILIGDDCIIAEENEVENMYSETFVAEDCLTEIDSSNIVETEIGELSIGSNELQFEDSDSFVNDCENNKHMEESWVEDVACIETVVSEDIAEDIVISAPCSSKTSDSSDIEDNSESDNMIDHTDKVKFIYGDKMCRDDAQFVDTLYNTPQMDVNKTLNRKESLSSDECTKYYDNESLEKILSGSNSQDQIYSSIKGSSYLSPSFTAKPCCKENMNVDGITPLSSIEKVIHDLDTENATINGIERDTPDIKKQNSTIHSCESSIDDVFSYDRTEGTNYTSSSPEVSSTTSEEKNSSILLKITNIKGSRISQINDFSTSNSPRCKYTEKKDYLQCTDNAPSNRPLLTKAAQKYIPPLKETICDLKVKLSLPPQSLIKLKQLKLSNKIKPKIQKHTNPANPANPSIGKKSKPKFEDVLKSIDEIQFKMHKDKTKRTKKSIPKVVIKKGRNGSHYASTSNKDSFNPDLTGRKWQPWVFIERNNFIDKMALRKKTKAIYNHRKKCYVLAENFQKYKSVNNSKFVISQQRINDSSAGHLKYTIRLKPK